MLKKIIPTIDLLIRIALHGAVLFLALSFVAPATKKAPRPWLQSLWSGLDKAYTLPGSQFKIFKPYVRKKDPVSLILDRPITATTKDKETARDVQNFLAPTLINFETVEPTAIVYCSSASIARQRLTETGYEWEKRITPSKGMARRIQ